MILKKMSLINYKNIESAQFDFDNKINCFIGNNGVGKTNLLDAIYHLAFGKSYFSSISSHNIRHHQDFYVIDGIFEKNKKNEHIICSLKQRKIINRNGKSYKKLSEHLGLISAVIISPTDRDLINEKSDIRRKLIDSIICQYDRDYLQSLIAYKKAIEQRNALLKFFHLNNTFDKTSLSLYDLIIIERGTYLHKLRKDFIDNFNPLLKKIYTEIAQKDESVDVSYISDLNQQSAEHIITSSLEKDRRLQYTSKGIHKDDLAFSINGHPIKRFGSQGQQKSFLIALKLAKFNFIKLYCKQTPILLLDDIFDKLDNLRVKRLVEIVSNQYPCQIFISDTDVDRTEKIIKDIGTSYKIIEVV